MQILRVLALTGRVPRVHLGRGIMRLKLTLSRVVLLALVMSILAPHASCQSESFARWKARGGGILIRLWGGRVVSTDLQSGVTTSAPLPDPEGGSGPARLLERFAGDSSHYYFTTNHPEPGLWSVNVHKRELGLVSHGQPEQCWVTNVEPEVTPSGDTVWGSFPFVTSTRAGFDVDINSGAVFVITNNQVMGWHPGLQCKGDPDSLSERLQQVAIDRYTSGESSLWWEMRLQSGEVSAPPLIEGDGVLGYGFHVAPDGKSALYSGKCCPRNTVIVLAGDRKPLIRYLVEDSSVGVATANYSPDGKTIVMAEDGYFPRLVLLYGQHFDAYQPLCRLDKIKVHDLLWTNDGAWILAVGRSIMFGEGGDYLAVCAIEVSSGLITVVEIDEPR